MSGLEQLGFRVGVAFARGLFSEVERRKSRGARAPAPPPPPPAAPPCTRPGCVAPIWKPSGRYCTTHHSRFYAGRPMDALCRCGKAVKISGSRCKKCKKKDHNAANRNLFARRRADPAWWAERKAKIAAQARARRAAAIQAAGAVVAARLWRAA